LTNWITTQSFPEAWVDVFSIVKHRDPMRVIWKNQDEPVNKAGIFWAAKGDGHLWFSDGYTILAGVSMQRLVRFWSKGSERRFKYLGDRYFKGIPPIGKGDKVINFGANVGELCILLSGSSRADVTAIEPDPVTLKALKANADLYGFHVEDCAAWKENGSLTMYPSPETADTSVFGEGEEILVDAKVIDSIAPGGPIRLICGDAEGAEPEVLMGATETLQRTEYVSLCCSAERAGETTLDPCERILRGHGFEILSRQETSFCQLIGRKH
jgi:FkbM family methyltransferase